jgi:hypothetical protein
MASPDFSVPKHMIIKTRITSKEYKIALSHSSIRRTNNLEGFNYNKFNNNKSKSNLNIRKYPLETISE